MKKESTFQFAFLCLIGLILSSCSYKMTPRGDVSIRPPSPDYSQEQYWAALPNKIDSADRVPIQDFSDMQATAPVDVFFLHPTTYSRKKINNYWNAPLDSEEINSKTDKGSILHQASIFNAAGRIYAPRYRQAHLSVFFDLKNQQKNEQALSFAYEDVKAAFSYYLKHYNQGRPIILAGHSQGALHGKQLVKEFFNGTELEQKLVVAYLVGMPIIKNELGNIKLCQDENDTNCFCSWRTVKKGYTPKRYNIPDVVLTNPINWKTDNTYAAKELNEGTVLSKFNDDLHVGMVDAQIEGGFLWSTKPKFPWSFLITFRNYHVADFNFFYANVRENAVNRSKHYLAQLSEKE